MVKKEPAKPAKKKAAAHVEKPVKKTEARYHFSIGRRKTAQAKVRLYPDGKGEITINGRSFTAYFPTEYLQKLVMDPFTVLGLDKKFNVQAMTQGGGVASQAKAIGLGIARALLLVEPTHRTVLKKQDLLTRDARKKERKKPGLKRARRAPQWQKR